MKNEFLRRLAAVVALYLSGLVVFANAADQLPARAKASKPPIEQTEDSGPLVGQGFVVQDLFGGQIFGYGVDENGTEGLLSEAVSQPGGTYLIATETFSQATGRILALVEVRAATRDDFVTLGVVGSHIGLRKWEHVQGLYVPSTATA